MQKLKTSLAIATCGTTMIASAFTVVYSVATLLSLIFQIETPDFITIIGPTSVFICTVFVLLFISGILNDR